MNAILAILARRYVQNAKGIPSESTSSLRTRVTKHVKTVQLERRLIELHTPPGPCVNRGQCFRVETD
jgi:hypothetical protein